MAPSGAMKVTPMNATSGSANAAARTRGLRQPEAAVLTELR